jgi:predicted extracellular nuclease
MKKIFTIFSIFLLVVGLYCPTLAEVSSLSAPAGNKVTKATSSATETTPIYNIQYVETPASNDSSLLVGQTVTVSGIVTGYVKASSYSKYYVQEETGSWHGIYVYDNKSGATLSVGDKVNVTGSIAEYYGLTELMATSVEVISSGNTLPEPVKITGAITEAEEGILVTLENAVLTTDVSSDTKKYLLATVNGVEYKIFGDLFKQVSFEEGGKYNITGLVTYTYNYFRICPRSADDVVAATSSDEPSIYDIQYVADPSVKDSSSYVGQEVTVSGIVTGYLKASSYSKYYVQEETGSWHGIYVYDNKSGATLSVGDKVNVTGSIAEYYGLTELMATSVEVISSGNTLPEPVKITGAITEAEEGILVTLENAVLTTDVSSDTKKYLLATVNGVEYKIFGDLFKQVSFEEGGKYNITGLVTYTFNYFRICPRSADDVVVATPNVSNLIEFEMDSLAYQVIVDYSNNNGLNGAKNPETKDDYFGASSYYKNFDTQYDGSFDNEKFSSWEEAVKNSIANIVLPARFPSAVESDSIEVSFTYYNGSKSGTDAFIFVYNNGTFAPVNNRAEIYSVAVAGQIDKTLVIDKAAKTVTLQVESGTNVAALVPTISYSYGATISPASGVAQNFSEPVAYTVTSEKGVSAIWTVTVTVMSNATTPIYDIQYVANPAANDSSSFVGETVIAQGIVTGFAQFSSYNKYYIQDEASFWHGIYVYDNKTSTILDMGDKVKVRGAVSEYYGLTELMASSVEVVSSRNTLPDPIVVDELSEQTEGILVTIEGVTLETDVDAEDYASALYLIAKKDGKEYKIYNEFFKDFTPEAGKKYNVTGPVTFVRSHFRISPRFADDFAVATGVNEYFQNKNLSVYPNPAANILTVEGTDAIEVTIRNIVGQTVMVSPLNNNKVDVSTLEKGIYFIQAGKTFARFVKL